jgi:hypothetical protein
MSKYVKDVFVRRQTLNHFWKAYEKVSNMTNIAIFSPK